MLLSVDFPAPPLNPMVTRGPDTTSLRLEWEIPDDTSRFPVIRSLDGFQIQVRESDQDEYQTILSVAPNITSVDVTGLHPGTMYWIVVASVNDAGASPSAALNVTTQPDCETL